MFLAALKMPHGVSDYEVHQHLHLQFNRPDRPFLFRRDNHCTSLIHMLSIERPMCPSVELSLDRLRPQYPMPFAADLIITRSTSIPGQRGQRRDVRDHDDRRKWLREKLNECADVPFARMNERWLQLPNGTRRLVVSTTGTLVITDAARFAARLQAGIGRGRAFGCGLIWIPEVMDGLAN